VSSIDMKSSWIVSKNQFKENYVEVKGDEDCCPRWLLGVFLILAHYLVTLIVLFVSCQGDIQTVMYLSATAITTTGYEAMTSLELTQSLQLFQVFQVCTGLFFIMAVAQGLINVVMYHIVTKKLKSEVSVQRSF